MIQVKILEECDNKGSKNGSKCVGIKDELEFDKYSISSGTPAICRDEHTFYLIGLSERPIRSTNSEIYSKIVLNQIPKAGFYRLLGSFVISMVTGFVSLILVARFHWLLSFE